MADRTVRTITAPTETAETRYVVAPPPYSYAGPVAVTGLSAPYVFPATFTILKFIITLATVGVIAVQGVLDGVVNLGIVTTNPPASAPLNVWYLNGPWTCPIGSQLAWQINSVDGTAADLAICSMFSL